MLKGRAVRVGMAWWWLGLIAASGGAGCGAEVESGAPQGGPQDAPPSAGGEPGEPSATPADDEGREAGAGPRVRSFFPETLLFAPSVITDEEGFAQVPLTMADSITTWRVAGLASTADGRVGSGSAALRVFQEFFVEVDLPRHLTQNDRFSVPVAVFNYLDQPQEITLTVDQEATGDWAALLDGDARTLTLGPGEVTAVHFRIQAQRPGLHPFQVTARAGEVGDAVRRLVEVLPDGQPHTASASGVVGEATTEVVVIPDEAIEGSTSLLIKIFPGLFSQVVDGFEGMLRQPSGCFEQTSSTTYPNALILAYLRDSGASSDEVEARAMDYLKTGYQRLVSYEVPGGGFEWFGRGPAHRILTAYGLLEFHDMSRVMHVDPELLLRTQRWLISQQEPDGRWRAAPDGIQEGATNSFTDSDLRATAYITYALLETRADVPGVDRAVEWLLAHALDAQDAYTLALLANALLLARPDAPTLQEVFARLEGLRQAEGERFWWTSSTASMTYGQGDTMTIETTALVAQAMIRRDPSSADIPLIINALLAHKDALGAFHSTQATILTLRALIEQLRQATEPATGVLQVSVDGRLLRSFEVDGGDAELAYQVDASALASPGAHVVSLALDGVGTLRHQIVSSWYAPWPEQEAAPQALSLAMTYDRRELRVGELAEVTATLTNASEVRQDMVMLDLGVPPGFQLNMELLEAMAADPAQPVSRVERRGREATLYLYGLDPGQEVSIRALLQATTPLEVTTPPSAAWLYYDRTVRVEDEPVSLVVVP